MTRFDKAQLTAFIRAIDRNLTRKVKVVMVGGAAAAVAYDASVTTADLDIFNVLAGPRDALGAAAEAARKETGLGISVGAAAVVELPCNYEARLKAIRGLKMKNLTIIVPDKYDLALSKTIRGYPHDIDAVESISKHHRLAQKILVERFENELMKEAVADQRKIALNVVMVVARLYGFEAGRKLAGRWGVPTPLATAR